ncbi:hypothetical protein Leryth_019105 [Lithospermum erythrorhizon]|nr:hypothetical protein Leryth_019105 [Lithospermum erythrorhizon]
MSLTLTDGGSSKKKGQQMLNKMLHINIANAIRLVVLK